MKPKLKIDSRASHKIVKLEQKKFEKYFEMEPVGTDWATLFCLGHKLLVKKGLKTSLLSSLSLLADRGKLNLVLKNESRALKHGKLFGGQLVLKIGPFYAQTFRSRWSDPTLSVEGREGGVRLGH